MFVVRSITFNKNGVSKANKPYKFHEISVVGNGKTKTAKAFDKTPLAEQMRSVKVGDMVDCTFDDSEYANLIGVFPAKATPAEVKTAVAVAAANTFAKDTEPTRIARSVALKAATELYIAALNKEMFKKTITPAALASEILATAKGYDKYLTLAEDEEEIVGMVDDIELEQDPF